MHLDNFLGKGQVVEKARGDQEILHKDQAAQYSQEMDWVEAGHLDNHPEVQVDQAPPEGLVDQAPQVRVSVVPGILDRELVVA